VDRLGATWLRLGKAGLLVAACAMSIAGCGGTDYDLAPVSGRLTLNGQPVPDMMIFFQPVAKDPKNPRSGPGSTGRTDADGRYVLKTADRRRDEGAVVGNHVVRMMVPDDRPDTHDDMLGTRRRNPLPSEASDGSLQFEVPPGGTDQADFQFY